MKQPIIIDSDPGIDDAAAISIALNHPNFDLRMITTVNGNVGIEKTTANALKLNRFFSSTVPVHRGSSQPLLSEIVDASAVHGDIVPIIYAVQWFSALSKEIGLT